MRVDSTCPGQGHRAITNRSAHRALPTINTPRSRRRGPHVHLGRPTQGHRQVQLNRGRQIAGTARSALKFSPIASAPSRAACAPARSSRQRLLLENLRSHEEEGKIKNEEARRSKPIPRRSSLSRHFVKWRRLRQRRLRHGDRRIRPCGVSCRKSRRLPEEAELRLSAVLDHPQRRCSDLAGRRSRQDSADQQPPDKLTRSSSARMRSPSKGPQRHESAHLFDPRRKIVAELARKPRKGVKLHRRLTTVLRPFPRSRRRVKVQRPTHTGHFPSLVGSRVGPSSVALLNEPRPGAHDI